MLDYTLTINGVNFMPYIERDSYKTSKIPVYSESVMTIDGYSHVALLRNKNEISFEFNPQNSEDISICANALLSLPCEVYFYSLQTQQYEYANMTLTQQVAQYLSRCLYRGERWNQAELITLTEL